MNIYDYKTSREILEAYLENLDNSLKKGIHKRISEALRIFPSYLSLILNGSRSLNLDQGILLADFMKLGNMERRYLLRVIELDRAQTARLKEEIDSELEEIRAKESQISSRVSKSKTSLNSEEMATFFSSWSYSAVHLIAAIDPHLTPAVAAKNLRLEIEETKKIFAFLIETKLWIKNEKGIHIGPQAIHLDTNSEFLMRHHTNWRLKAIDNHRSMNKNEELSYSVCMALSKKDSQKIRTMILNYVKEIRDVCDPSPSETLYHLNIDWLQV